MPDTNMTVQLLTIYTNPVCQNAQCYRQTDTQTTLGHQEPIVLLRSANNRNEDS